MPSAGDAPAPRFREAGEVTLDRYHRDARVADSWVGLTPREFALFWQLAGCAGEAMTAGQLLADAWHGIVEPATPGVAEHIERLRGRLAVFGLAHLIVVHPQGGYILDQPPV